MIDPETALVMFVVGGVGAVVSFAAFKIAEETGPKIEASGMLPMPPDKGLPLPRGLGIKWPWVKD